jgi:hypothetical protein
MTKVWCLICVLFVFSIFPLSAQTEAVSDTSQSEKNVIPPFLLQFGKDIHRSEVVLFGSFPFAWFTATFFMDLYRSSQHDWNDKYYPWPLKPAGAIDMSNDEYITCLYISAALSIGVAIADHLVISIKRFIADKKNRQYPEGEPIIIRRPLYEDDDDDDGKDDESSDTDAF